MRVYQDTSLVSGPWDWSEVQGEKLLAAEPSFGLLPAQIVSRAEAERAMENASKLVDVMIAAHHVKDLWCTDPKPLPLEAEGAASFVVWSVSQTRRDVKLVPVAKVSVVVRGSLCML
jgi:hypothetical protein